MPPSGIVKALDVIKHVGFRLVACAVRGPRRALGLQRREEAFHRRVVPAVAGAAHATSKALVCQKSLERLTGILAAPIGVMQHGLGLAPPPDRHHQRIRDQLHGHRRLHGPADDPSGEEIHDRRDVEPPFGGPEVGEVGHPFAVRGWGVKLAIEHIRRDRAGHPRAGIGGHSPSSWPRPQGVAPHQPLDPMQAASLTLGQQVVPDASRTIGPVTLQETRPDLGSQYLVAMSARASWTCQPRIEATPRDTERLT